MSSIVVALLNGGLTSTFTNSYDVCFCFQVLVLTLMPLYGVHELPVELRIVLTSSKSTSRSWSVLKRGTHNAASEVVRRKPFAFKAPEIKPWSATLLYADFRGKDPTGNLVRELGKHSRAGDAKQCMQLLEALKNERRYSGQSVTLHMYKLALTALAKNGLYRESCRLVEEIADTPGQHADIGCFNLLLKVCCLYISIFVC